ncbi:MAG: hypothetical protein M3077_04925 [Candidatus Dormibacteraeota bacterium]|nr:hypothetical protein [Candidatus Dormibacteraeota bacterium]
MRRFLLLAAIVLAGCGARGAGPASGTVSATNGPLVAQASPAQLAPGDTVHVSLTVTGPVDYEVGCVQTLHIWAVDAQGTQVWAQPVPAIMCMAYGHKLLAGGETATFKADWPTSATLAPGSYTIHGLFLTVLPRGVAMRVRENLPLLTVAVRP